MVDTYVIPLRREFLKAPRYKRAKKTLKVIKKFLIRHLKIRDKDEKKIKIDAIVNEAIWCRGIKHPPQKITVKVKKQDDEFVVTFVSLPSKFKEEEKRLKKKQEKLEKIRAEKERVKKKKKAEEEAKKAEQEKKEKEKEKTEEEKKEEQEEKEKDKLLKKVAPIKTKAEKIAPTQSFGSQHRKALQK